MREKRGLILQAESLKAPFEIRKIGKQKGPEYRWTTTTCWPEEKNSPGPKGRGESNGAVAFGGRRYI